MKTYQIRSFPDLHAQAERNVKAVTFYRGQRDINWKLIPKVGRLKLPSNISRRGVERALLDNFIDRAIPFIGSGHRDEWDWLTLAQHHGLPTRLLDWSKNLLVAAFFAIDEDHDGDSAIYAIQPEYRARSGFKSHPLDLKDGVFAYSPRHNSQRLIAQQGCFTVYGDPEIEAPSELLECFVIEQKFRRSLKALLNRYGINRSTIFPDLDGLAKYLEWAHFDAGAGFRLLPDPV